MASRTTLLLVATLLIALAGCSRPAARQPEANTPTAADNNCAPAPEPRQGEPAPEVATYLVTRVVDGDTIEVEMDAEKVKVRLLCIDTPERGQDGFDEATVALKALIGDAGRVQLVYDPKHDKVDFFGRELCYVIADGVNTNVEMVRLGHTKYWTKYGKSSLYEAEFLAAEQGE